MRTAPAAQSELANVEMQAHLVMWRALIQQVMCEGPVKKVCVPGVVLRVFERMACSVFVAPGACTGPVFLQAALRWSSKAGMASPMRRSAWPGMCALAGGGSGR